MDELQQEVENRSQILMMCFVEPTDVHEPLTVQ